MLEEYLEPVINHQALLLTILLAKKRISFHAIQQKTGFSLANIKRYIHQLEELFQGDIAFEWDSTIVRCTVLKRGKPFLKTIYRQSVRLHILKFLLIKAPYYKVKSVSGFAREHFISTPSAYRLIQHMKPFVEECGLALEDNSVVGEEWRIRYLIALLHDKYGIVIYELTDHDLDIVHDFIFSIKKQQTPHPLLDKKFRFFDVLLSLSWKRREFDVAIPQEGIFKRLKSLALYGYLEDFFKREGKLLLDMDFPSSEIDYIFLVYLTVNNSFSITQWSEEDSSTLLTIIQEDPAYQELLGELRQLFGHYIAFDKACIQTLIPYFRKTLFDLSLFIPQKYYYAEEYQGSKLLANRIELMINSWADRVSGVGRLTGSNLHLLCTRLEQLVREGLPPLAIAVIEINKKNIDILYSLVMQQVSPCVAKVYRFNILSEAELLWATDFDLIVTTAEMTAFIEERLSLNENTKILDFNFDFVMYQAEYLSQVIRELRDKQYQEALDTILNG